MDDGHGEYLTYAVNLLDKWSVSGSSAGSQINVDLTPINLGDVFHRIRQVGRFAIWAKQHLVSA